MKNFYLTSESSNKVNQDRVLHIPLNNDTCFLLLADGAGGFGSGDKAAEFILHFFKQNQDDLIDKSAEGILSMLNQVDLLLHQKGIGESTVVALVVKNNFVYGASVGDSEAWFIAKNEVNILTSAQSRKPLIGSGESFPRLIEPFKISNGTLLIGSDGLFKYTSMEKIKKAISEKEPKVQSDSLLNSVKLNSGTLQDDTSFLIINF